jgi:hypothetical protein
MKRWILILALSVLSSPALAAGRLAQVEVVDALSGKSMAVYYDNGRYYIAGVPGREYSIRLRNCSHADLLAVVSVDGVNVVTGETAAIDQGGYILNRRQRFDIKGWRKSLDQVAAFYFSSVDASYAARTGRPDHVGVIGVALFKRRVDYPLYDELDAPAGSAAPHARRSEGRSADSEQLGTGHGRRKHSAVRYGEFERASETPDEVVTIYYDTHANLVAQGIIPAKRGHPEPFPNGFVADPPHG